MDYDPASLEEKWRERWRESGRYQATPDEEEATFVTVPYPYPSGGMHIGHCRTYTVPDAWARYRRLQGDNVLFPIAWHVTGTPIVGAVERLKKGEEEQLSTLRDTFGVPEDELEDLETPMGFARYFIENHYKEGMQGLGLSIDWRREFTTNDEHYSKFITWQYETLKERGLLEKGLHPVNYCTNEEQPVTTHDLLEGEEAEFQEFTLIRFRDGDTVIPMATLRPETVRGVTNAYVDPNAEYVQTRVDGEEWIVSREAVEKLRLQDRDVDVEASFPGSDLVGGYVENPVTGEEVLILPATFVDPDNAAGVVMSVPAHSPDDYAALREIQEDPDYLADYGIDPGEVREIEPIPILEIEGYGEIPARDALEEHDALGVPADDPAVHEATEDLYQAEFTRGRLLASYGEFAGEVIEEARERFREHHRRAGNFDTMYEFTEEVVCRCGGDVEVAERETWFLRYNDEEWQAKARAAVEGLDAIPENTREEYEHTIDWLEEWPCIRNYGLGTRLPWDEEFVIEPLSDSTIYMAYYTIAHRIDEIPPEDLDRAFFDALFYGPDGADAPPGVEVDIDNPDERALDLREEWRHWYPVDYRCSANDLISNHLTFFLYHHAELFADEYWPGGITVMGMGLLEGEKMSSSKGHVVLPGEAIEEYGADTVRFFLLNSAEPWQDYDWREDAVENVESQLRRFWNRAHEVVDAPAGERDLERIDRWLLSKLQGVVREATEAMEGFETRTASQAAFYDLEEYLRWYRRRADLDRPGARWTRREVLRTRLRLLAPFVPFMANELHEELAGEPVEDATWPEADESLEDDAVEAEEDLLSNLLDDVREVIDVTGQEPETIRVYTAADWKYRVFGAVVEAGPDVGEVMSRVMQDEDLRERGEEVNQLAQDLVEFVRDEPDERVETLRALSEVEAYKRATGFLEAEFDANVEVYREDESPPDPGDKAGDAVPFRPAIYIE